VMPGGYPAGYHRPATPVRQPPAAPHQAANPYAYNRPPAAKQRPGGFNRQLFTVLAIILGALVVLLCTGLIAFLVNERISNANALGQPVVRLVTAENQMASEHVEINVGAVPSVEAHGTARQDDDHTSEGRQGR
jgi:hypothetical protein